MSQKEDKREVILEKKITVYKKGKRKRKQLRRGKKKRMGRKNERT